MTSVTEQAARNLAAVRSQNPLIHNITNFVVMNSTANALLAMGASPVMAHAANEVEDMVALAGALVLNIGTLTDEWVASMIKAGQKAAELGKPVLLDPVGSGATPLRTRAAKQILEQTKVTVIRGNASEILSLRQEDATTRGVDSRHAVDEAVDTARLLAGELNTTLVITGPVDLVTDGTRVLRVSNGHEMMSRITGSGCAASVTVAAFLAVDKDPVTAAATALSFFGLAGEVAACRARAPGAFMIALQDALYTLSPDDLRKGCKISL